MTDIYREGQFNRINESIDLRVFTSIQMELPISGNGDHIVDLPDDFITRLSLSFDHENPDAKDFLLNAIIHCKGKFAFRAFRRTLGNNNINEILVNLQTSGMEFQSNQNFRDVSIQIGDNDLVLRNYLAPISSDDCLQKTVSSYLVIYSAQGLAYYRGGRYPYSVSTIDGTNLASKVKGLVKIDWILTN